MSGARHIDVYLTDSKRPDQVHGLARDTELEFPRVGVRLNGRGDVRVNGRLQVV